MEVLFGTAEVSSFALLAYLFYELQKKKYKMIDLLEFLTKSTVFNPEHLKRILNGKAPQKFLESFRDFEQGKDYARGLAFVQGQVGCPNPIISTLNKRTKLIYSTLSVESLFSAKKRKIGGSGGRNNILYVPEFELKDSSFEPPNLRSRASNLADLILESMNSLLPENMKPLGSLGSIIDANTNKKLDSLISESLKNSGRGGFQVIDSGLKQGPKPPTKPQTSIKIKMLNPETKTKLGPALEMIHSSVTTRALSPIEKLVSLILRGLKLLLLVSSFTKNIQGFKFGTKKIETGIKVGQFIVAFGEVVYNKQSGEMRMENPLCLLKNKGQMVVQLKEKRDQLHRSLSMVFTLMTLSGGLCLRRGYRLLKYVYRQMRKKKQMRKMEKLVKVSREIDDEYKCIICCDLAKNVIFKPCMHMACCAICYEKLADNKCIICKQEIEDVVKIYLD